MTDQMRQAAASSTSEFWPEPNSLESTIIQNVSHELRTPLTIIQGYVELLHNGELGALTPEQQQAMFIITNHTQELRALVERIGVLMALEVHQKSAWQPLAPAEIVAGVMESRHAAAIQSGLMPSVDLEPNLPLISGDLYQLQQVVDCLLDNALKFTPAGGRVKVQLYSEPGLVCLTVSDTGIGISEENQERIFSRFYQVDGSTTRHYRGVGLGLAIVKQVIEEHGGQLEVESQPGQGSRFTVKLPALPSDIRLELPLEEKEKSVTLQRILVVDDEENIALILQESLEGLPHCQVAIATSGTQALQMFEQQPFDLLITDYRMPEINGIALATHVRQLYPQTAIVMITAYSSAELYEQAAHAAVRRVLDKPVKLAEIRSVASESLARSGDVNEKDH